jgi:hypothetical protein
MQKETVTRVRGLPGHFSSVAELSQTTRIILSSVIFDTWFFYTSLRPFFKYRID